MLTLNAGVEAADRRYLNTEEYSETFLLSGLDAGVVDVEFDGFVARYTGVTRVVANLGEGDDLLDASRLLNNVLLAARGGEGDDTILLGMGGGTVVDLKGNNTIRALPTSIRPVTFITGSGDDELSGGAGDDVLFAGAGSNKVFAGAGNDTLYGVLGTNRLVGNEGQDRY
ncbi:MAG: calcium-binding protein, partial [bacterium]